MVSMDSTVGMASLPLGNGGTLNPSPVLLRPWQGGEWHLTSARFVSKSGPIYTTREMVGLLLARSLLGPSWVRVRATGIFFCRVWMEYNTYYVKVSCLFQLLPSWSSGFVCLFVFGVLGAGRAFICLWPSAFPGCQLLHFQASDTWGKKKSQGAHHYIISRFPRCLTSLPSSAHPSVFLCLS